ncbi:MAG: hypothetical protein LBT14_07205 [Treponema sp.]|jgi:hypothetical protein|nr:hypothetical protein [Treponema sp.]
MKKTMVWAATPEAEAILEAGYEAPVRGRFNCPKMQVAQKQAEQAVKEIAEEKRTKKETEEKK